jgi:hypothetical protein
MQAAALEGSFAIVTALPKRHPDADESFSGPTLEEGGEQRIDPRSSYCT